MAENTAISWADDTFNPWIGLHEGLAGLRRLLRRGLMATRYGRGSGARRARGRHAPAHLGQQLGQAAEVGARAGGRFLQLYCDQPRWFGKDYPAPRFVFCASLADVFDNAVPVEWRRDLFDLIRKTPHLTWLLLTKRPGTS
jgi:protein gp37